MEAPKRKRPPSRGRVVPSAGPYPQRVQVRQPQQTSRQPVRPQPYDVRGYPMVVRPRRRHSFISRWLHTPPSMTAIFIYFTVGILALILIPLFLATGFYGYYQVTERIVPNVSAGEMELSGKTVHEAAAELQAIWNIENSLEATDGVRTWMVKPSAVGLWIDASATALQAYAVAHGQDFLTEANQMVDVLKKGYTVEPVLIYRSDTARSGLEELAPQVNIPPVDAALYYRNGELFTTPSVRGYALDIDGTLATLDAAPLAIYADGRLPLKMKAVDPRILDAGGALEEAKRLLDSPFSITVYDTVTGEYIQWEVPRETLGTWLTIDSTEAGIVPSIAPDRTLNFLTEKNTSLGNGRFIDVQEASQQAAQAVREGRSITLITRHEPTTYTVQPGDTLIRVGWNTGFPYWKILEKNPDINPDALIPGQVLNIPSKDEMLPLPVISGKRILISISQQRLWTFENGSQTGEYIISTGIDRSPTQPGVFQVRMHDPSAYASLWDLTMPNFIGIYEAWPGFFNGMHGLPTLSGGQILWANILGRPASYGCIILDLDDAEYLYNWAEEGVVVEIQE